MKKSNAKQIVVETLQQVVNEKGINIVVAPELVLFEMGIDSLGLISVLIDLEDKLCVELDGGALADEVLHTVSDLINLFSK